MINIPRLTRGILSQSLCESGLRGENTFWYGMPLYIYLFILKNGESKISSFLTLFNNTYNIHTIWYI